MRLEQYIVDVSEYLIDVLKVIEKNQKSIAFVCRENKLFGLVTDGDIRRYMITGGKLDSPISMVANTTPIFIYEDEKKDIKGFMRERQLKALPVVDHCMHIVDVVFWDDFILEERRTIDIPVVIMAGGKGSRLQPYTEILPKPLMPVGGISITEHIIRNFEKYHCNEIYIIINYMKEFIKTYFKERIIKNIQFIEEEEFLGTGGGLYLLKEKIQETFFLTNCDILVEADYGKIYDIHKEKNNILTMVCVNRNQILPYGTVEMGECGNVVAINEKPEFSYYINTGLYIIEPEFMEMIPQMKFVHITDIINDAIRSGKRIGGYSVSEDCWLDMGQIDELEKMKVRMQSF